MELINATRMQAGYTLGLDPDGRERVVVAIKGTFAIPWDGSEPHLAEEQIPLVMADEFTGEPGFSATRYESDFPPFKPRCDVLVNGSAWAPNGRATPHVAVGLRIATVAKAFEVVGDRIWEDRAVGVRPSEPQPFVQLPITYDRAYGGVDVAADNPEKVDAYRKNPVGVGHYPYNWGRAMIGRRLPNTQERGRPADSHNGRYEPMSFGPIGRNFESRVPLAGTYDQEWLDNVFPFLPSDFDPLYHQSAPADQQIDHPVGGEWVELYNLTPQGYTRFPIPRIDMPVEFTNAKYERTETRALIDTITIEPDRGLFTMVWRISHPLQRNIMEMRQAVAGWMSRGWYRARDLGKTWYPTLHQLAIARKEENA